MPESDIVERLRAHILPVRNWQREMERSCDAIREMNTMKDPHLEEAALGNAHVAETLEDAGDLMREAADLITTLRAAVEQEREECARVADDLRDRILSLFSERFDNGNGHVKNGDLIVVADMAADTIAAAIRSRKGER